MSNDIPDDKAPQISLPPTEILINIVNALDGHVEDLKSKISVHTTCTSALRHVLSVLEEHDRPLMITPVRTERERQKLKESVQFTTNHPEAPRAPLTMQSSVQASQLVQPRRILPRKRELSEEHDSLKLRNGKTATPKGQDTSRQKDVKDMKDGGKPEISTAGIPSFPPVRACIFDLDGTLIDSEDIYTDICTDVLHSYGKPSIPLHIKLKAQSRRGREGLQVILDWASLSISQKEWAAKCRVQHDRFKSCKLLPGVERLLRSLSALSHWTIDATDPRPQIHLAIASSSNTSSFGTRTSHLPIIKECIPRDVCVLGDDPALNKTSRKSRSDIFLLALERINKAYKNLRLDTETYEAVKVKPEECLVFEDSISGVHAAREAGMRVVLVLDKGWREFWQGREGALVRETIGWDEMSEDQKKTVEGPKRALTWKDGSGEIVWSLEDLDLGRYGIGD